MSDKGNTIGRVYGPVPLADVPAWAANPPIVAKTPEQAAWRTRLRAAGGGPGDIPQIEAVFDPAGALVYPVASTAALHLSAQEATPGTAQKPRPGKGRDGAKVLGKGEPAICLECLLHAASSGAVTLERL